MIADTDTTVMHLILNLAALAVTGLTPLPPAHGAEDGNAGFKFLNLVPERFDVSFVAVDG